MKNLKKYLKGFTLVELIIVITILAILGTIGFVSFQGYTRDARDANRLSNIQSIQKGFEIFQVTSGAYPQPDEATIYTGGLHTYIKQGVVGDQVSSLIKMTQVPVDPSNGQKYVYSVFGNTKYYQVAGEKESLSSSVFPIAYADVKSAIVRGNYTMDPSLPSLIMVPGSFTGSSIFHPNICFVVDGGENTLDTCYQTKSQMALNSFDKSLVGYWSFDEAGFHVENHIYGGTNFYKDYSGNGNHAFNSGSYLGSGFIPPTQTGGYIGSGALYFTSGALYLGGLEKDIFGLPYENISISMIANLFEYKNPYPYLINTFHSVWNISCHDYPNCNNQFSNEFLGFQLHSKTNTGASNGHQRGYVPGNLILTNVPYYYTFVYDGNYLKTYLNGKLYGEIKKSMELSYAVDDLNIQRLDRVLRLGGGTNRTRDFHGIIDDVKIYNRTLSDQEIAQQAKIAGF